MTYGEFLTRATIWVALCGYSLGAGMLLLARDRRGWLARARWAWTLGCAFFIAHVICAFGYYHAWSHAAAYLDTAQQTAAVTGFHWGGGLFFNYIFGLAWIADVASWWLAPAGPARRFTWLTPLWHGFMFFMVFNGTVVFGTGPVRWFGAVICAGLAWLWWSRRRGPMAAS